MVEERYITAEDILGTLDGQEFSSDLELQKAVIRPFNEHLADIPPGYTYLHLIHWSERQGWLSPTQNNALRLDLPKEEVSSEGL